MLIAAGADINAMSHFGFTPLFLAFKTNGRVVEALAPIIPAARYGREAEVMAILAGPNPPQDEILVEALVVACEFGRLGIGRALVAAGANVNSRNAKGCTGFHAICVQDQISENHIELARLLVDARAAVDLMWSNSYNETALVCLCSKRNLTDGHIELARLLAVEAHADVNLVGGANNLSAYESAFNHREKRRLLSAIIPFFDAVYNDRELEVRTMLASEDPPSREVLRDALVVALSRGLVGIGKALIAVGVAVLSERDLSRRFEESSLEVICSLNRVHEGHLELARLLAVEMRADVNQDTPLHSACSNGHESIVKMLVLEANVDINQAPRSPYEFAADSNRSSIMRFLASNPSLNILDRCHYAFYAL